MFIESQEMSTSSAHQQSLAEARSETRPPMLERGSYIPWASRFRRYLNRKRETQKFLNHSIDVGPYEFKNIQPNENEEPRLQTEDDLTGDVEIDRETRFNNEFDQFSAEPGESLVSVYNHFAQLMNDLERNNIIFPKVTIDTKFLNSLQPEWLNYVMSVRLARKLTQDSNDDLFDYLQQYEEIVIAYRAKKLEKTHDPLALVAHTSSSRSSPAYYVTHPPYVVDYDDEYQGETF
ncbi:hypothetical protein Tco_0115049 [Tanacetum coccineum]